MKKRIYIQPNCETIKVSMYELMDGNPLSGGSFPGGFPSSGAPAHAPVLPTDTVRTF